jgi:hypothetical protein
MEAGRRAVVRGILSRPELNGKIAELLSLGETLKITSEKLIPIPVDANDELLLGTPNEADCRFFAEQLMHAARGNLTKYEDLVPMMMTVIDGKREYINCAQYFQTPTADGFHDFALSKVRAGATLIGTVNEAWFTEIDPSGPKAEELISGASRVSDMTTKKEMIMVNIHASIGTMFAKTVFTRGRHGKKLEKASYDWFPAETDIVSGRMHGRMANYFHQDA